MISRGSESPCVEGDAREEVVEGDAPEVVRRKAGARMRKWRTGVESTKSSMVSSTGESMSLRPTAMGENAGSICMENSWGSFVLSYPFTRKQCSPGQFFRAR